MNAHLSRAVRDRLRRTIAPLHCRLDQHPIMVGLAEPQREGKSAYLEALKFLQPLWLNFSQRQPEMRPWSDALQKDVGFACETPRLEVSSLLALHYVMWGSTLGIRSLASKVPADWPRAFVDQCMNASIPVPLFQSFDESDVVAVKQIFVFLLEEADSHVAQCE